MVSLISSIFSNLFYFYWISSIWFLCIVNGYIDECFNFFAPSSSSTIFRKEALQLDFFCKLHPFDFWNNGEQSFYLSSTLSSPEAILSAIFNLFVSPLVRLFIRILLFTEITSSLEQPSS